MAALSTQNVNRTGITLSFASCAGGGDTFTPGSQTMLYVKNGGGTSQTVTVAASQILMGDIAIPNLTMAVSGSSEKTFGPFPASVYASSTGTTAISYTAVTSLTIAVISMEQP
jgi:hypothetical protein